VTDTPYPIRVDEARTDDTANSTDQPRIHPGVLQTATTASHPLGHQDNRLIYTIDEAAALLRISRSTAYECAHRGELPVLRLGRRVLVTRRALEQLLGIDRAGHADSRGPRRIRIVRGQAPRNDQDRPDWAKPHRRETTES
jgi:excisionase family DNA binding protein